MIKVLIADDEILVRAGLKAVLPWEENGFNVVGEAWNGEDAYQKILALRPDILITDIKMPKMDGIALLKKLRKENIPVVSIILSCFDDFDLVREGMKYGAKDYILKLSIEPEQLLAVLNEIKQELQLKKTAPDDLCLQDQDLKSLFVNKLTNHNFFSKEQIKNILFNLGLSINLNHYQLIRLLPEKKNLGKTEREKKSEILVYNILDQICKRQPGNEIFPLEKGEFLIVHSGGNWKNLRTQLSASMIEYANTNVFFGSSSILNGHQEFEIGMDQSKEAVECAVFYNQDKEIEYENICRFPVPSSPYQQEQELFQSLLSSVQDAAWNNCKNMLVKLKADCYPPAECFSYLMEILDIYRRAAKEFRVPLHSMEFKGRNICEYIKDLSTLQECELAFYEFTGKLTDAVRKSRLPRERDEILTIKQHVMLYYKDNIDLNTIAKLVNMSPSHLSSLFKKETGENFSTYLTEVRMEAAKRLLKSPHALIYEVAEQTGYANSSYFGKAFKKFYGFTPEEYKKNSNIQERSFLTMQESKDTEST